jgi:hypothetical protein
MQQIFGTGAKRVFLGAQLVSHAGGQYFSVTLGKLSGRDVFLPGNP